MASESDMDVHLYVDDPSDTELMELLEHIQTQGITRRPIPPWSPYSCCQTLEIPLTQIRDKRFDLIEHAQKLHEEWEK